MKSCEPSKHSPRQGFLTKCKFAIRSAGHVPYVGTSNMEDGVTLDLKYLNTVSYNAESASVGFRARRNIKRSLHCPRDPGAMFPGECSSSVGVGGPRTGRRDILLFTQPQLLL
ncbi:hypothetical protein ACJQWK_03821 [Exserohilum turcicum]